MIYERSGFPVTKKKLSGRSVKIGSAHHAAPLMIADGEHVVMSGKDGRVVIDADGIKVVPLDGSTDVLPKKPMAKGTMSTEPVKIESISLADFSKLSPILDSGITYKDVDDLIQNTFKGLTLDMIVIGYASILRPDVVKKPDVTDYPLNDKMLHNIKYGLSRLSVDPREIDVNVKSVMNHIKEHTILNAVELRPVCLDSLSAFVFFGEDGNVTQKALPGETIGKDDYQDMAFCVALRKLQATDENGSVITLSQFTNGWIYLNMADYYIDEFGNIMRKERHGGMLL